MQSWWAQGTFRNIQKNLLMSDGLVYIQTLQFWKLYDIKLNVHKFKLLCT